MHCGVHFLIFNTIILFSTCLTYCVIMHMTFIAGFSMERYGIMYEAIMFIPRHCIVRIPFENSVVIWNCILKKKMHNHQHKRECYWSRKFTFQYATPII